MQRYTYRAYGLTIQSEVEIPAFLQGTGPAQVQLRVNPTGQSALALPKGLASQPIVIQRSPSHTLWIHIQNVGCLRIQSGHLIDIFPEPEVSPRLLGMTVAGMGMSALLYQRGVLVLHGSAVKVGNQAVLFVGQSGAGKSSVALALHQAGYSILTDDLAAIETHGGPPTLLPAFPQMRLTQASAQAFQLDWPRLQDLSPLPKRGFQFTSSFCADPLPLTRIYLLQRSQDDITLQQLGGAESIMALLPHAEAMMLFSANRQAPLQACSQLIQRVPLTLLSRPWDWQAWPHLLLQLQQDWARGTTSPHRCREES
ncbi:hypothetical protein [Lyngbya confervoides]|uniref:Serine kinase n=1 Tax=Lyngbya confervoides BDU141951 TaxID=1574623 RepID=A0ABD4T271_9CYAN|nr:hypothetical protein [Lyngbya confervoides]MCM1982528.1 hypothetical protein [Lyngbya confervoides BDU141951]